MRQREIIKTAWFTRRRISKWMIIYVTLGFLCLLLATNIYCVVKTEKNQPCEIDVSMPVADENLLQEIKKTKGILAVTPVYQLQATLEVNGFSLTLEMEGVEESFLPQAFLYGAATSHAGNMPHIILTKPAALGFMDQNEKTIKEDAIESTLLSDISTLTIQKGMPVLVSGVIEDERMMGYTDIAAAKNICLYEGIVPTYSMIRLRLKNTGMQPEVRQALEAMGLQSMTTEMTDPWRYESLLYTILFVRGVLLLLLGYTKGIATVQNSFLQERDAYNYLRASGFSKRNILGLLQWQNNIWLGKSFVWAWGIYYLVPLLLTGQMDARNVFLYKTSIYAPLILFAIMVVFLFLQQKKAKSLYEKMF